MWEGQLPGGRKRGVYRCGTKGAELHTSPLGRNWNILLMELKIYVSYCRALARHAPIATPSRPSSMSCMHKCSGAVMGWCSKGVSKNILHTFVHASWKLKALTLAQKTGGKSQGTGWNRITTNEKQMKRICVANAQPTHPTLFTTPCRKMKLSGNAISHYQPLFSLIKETAVTAKKGIYNSRLLMTSSKSSHRELQSSLANWIELKKLLSCVMC